ncbi:MAG: hypothetical protein ACLP1X_07850, partial [Polyangiaceae bacterium]
MDVRALDHDLSPPSRTAIAPTLADSVDLRACFLAFRSAFFTADIIELGSRKVVHVAVTRHPSTTWVAQQLRNATPFGDGPRFVIRDNDDKFGPDFDRAAKGAGVRVLRTAPRAPLMNSFCERFLG